MWLHPKSLSHPYNPFPQQSLYTNPSVKGKALDPSWMLVHSNIMWLYGEVCTLVMPSMTSHNADLLSNCILELVP